MGEMKGSTVAFARTAVESGRGCHATKPAAKKAADSSAAASPGSAGSIAEFVEAVVPPARLCQGLHWLRERGLPAQSKASTGEFVKLVLADVMKEEGDQLEGWDGKLIKAAQNAVSATARVWFVAQCAEADNAGTAPPQE